MVSVNGVGCAGGAGANSVGPPRPLEVPWLSRIKPAPGTEISGVRSGHTFVCWKKTLAHSCTPCGEGTFLSHDDVHNIEQCEQQVRMWGARLLP